MRKLLLRDKHAVGDVVLLTGAVRDLHLSHPGRFTTDVRTDHSLLFQNSPYVSELQEQEAEEIQLHYPLIGSARKSMLECPYHVSHGYRKFLEEVLHVQISPTSLAGDIRLSEEEKDPDNSLLRKHKLTSSAYWLVNAGWKNDFTCKAWPTSCYETSLRKSGIKAAVQVGSEGDNHKPLNLPFCKNLVGKTDLRELCVLVRHAEGILTPVSGLMHLSAAIPASDGSVRPCVVVAGGRENPHWEQYPGHDFLHTCGRLSCCFTGGCWKARTSRQQEEKDPKTRKRISNPLNELICEQVIRTEEGLFPACMLLVQPDEVADRIARKVCSQRPPAEAGSFLRGLQ